MRVLSSRPHYRLITRRSNGRMTATVTTGRRTEPGAESADLALLTGAGASDLVNAVLAAEAGAAAVQDLDVQVHHVHHRPGSGVSVGYRVAYTTPAGSVRDYLVASTAPQAIDAPGVAVLDDGERVVRMWRRPFDPGLPGLRPASDPQVVRAWLHEAGLQVLAGEDLEIEVLSYRPTRRAVLRVGWSGRAVFLKVLPAGKCRGLAQRHQLLAEAGVAAPRLLAQPVEGVCMLSAARGRAMSQALAAHEERPDNLPPPRALIDWLDSLPAAVTDLRRRPAWSDRVDFHTAAAAAAVPQRGAEVRDLGARIGEVLADLPAEPIVPTHGDYYEANVFTEAGQVRDVIDVDSLGPGRRSDDLATMLGHVAVLPALAPAFYTDTTAVLRTMQERFETEVPARSLRIRTAAVVLSLVAGAKTSQAHTRLGLAADWLAAAGQTRRGAGRDLRDLSSSASAGLIRRGEDETRSATPDVASQTKE